MISRSTSASPRLGVSAFAIEHPGYPCDDLMYILEGVRRPAVAVLENTFGQDKRCLNRLLKKKNLTLQVHITNEATRDTPHRMTRNELGWWMTNKQYSAAWEVGRRDIIEGYRKRLRKWRSIQAQNPHVQYWISEGLESNGSVKAAERRLQEIRRYLPGAKRVWCPLRLDRPGRPSNAHFVELHGSKLVEPWPQRSIFNYDGTGIGFMGEKRGTPLFEVPAADVFGDIRKARREGVHFFLWESPSQGLARADWAYPRNRNFYFDDRDIMRRFLRTK